MKLNLGRRKMFKKEINQILKNQRDIMIWIGKGKYYEGYFSKRIEETEELLG